MQHLVFVAEKEDVSSMVNGNDREAKYMTIRNIFQVIVSRNNLKSGIR